MTNLLEIVRTRSEDIYQGCLPKLLKWPTYATAPESAIRWTYDTLLEALIDFWERGDEAKARDWADKRAHLSANLGFPVPEVLAGMDILAEGMRAQVMQFPFDPAALPAVLTELDRGIRLLRGSYIEAHFGMHEARLSALQVSAVELGADLSLEHTLEAFVASARSLGGARQAVLITSQMEVETSRRVIADPAGVAENLLWSSDFLTAFARDPRPFRLRDRSQDPRFSGLGPDHPLRLATLGVPVLSQGRLLGTLLLSGKEGAEVFSDMDQQLMELLSSHAAVAIVNARLYEEVRQQSVSRTLVGQMFRDLQTTGGLSQTAMFRAGKELAARVGAKSLPEFLEAFAAMGLGALVQVGADAGKRRWEFIGDGLVESRAPSGTPACNYARGFLCGAVSHALNGERVAAAELECQSMGDAACHFVVQVVARNGNR